MPPSTSTSVAAGVVKVLPPVGRDEMLVQCGLRSSAHWAGVDRAPRQMDDAADVDSTEAYGDEDFDGSAAALRALEALGFLIDGGWTAVDPGKGRGQGTTSHRGILHPDEYVDGDRLRVLVEDEFGFTYVDIQSVYSTGGRIPNHLSSLRDRIDARLLVLANAGANMDAFGRVVGINASTLDRALARARSCGRVAA